MRIWQGHRNLKHGLVALPLVAGACWVDNPHYRTPDLAQCPVYTAGGGGGRNRPEVLVPGGMGQIGGVIYPVSSFYLDVFEVTVAAYRECVDAGTCTRPQIGDDPDCNWTDSRGPRETQPINCVDWNQAQRFCAWSGRRLPLEEEWAYAAFGPPGRQSLYPWGKDDPQSGDAAQLCWGREVGAGDMRMRLGPCPVGSFRGGFTLLGVADCHGVADLGGNASEWMGGQFLEPYVYPAQACTSVCTIRGSSWDVSNPAAFQAGFRGHGFPVNAGVPGMRCARPG